MREIEYSSLFFINAKSQLIIYSKWHLSFSIRTEWQIMRLHAAQSICGSFFFSSRVAEMRPSLTTATAAAKMSQLFPISVRRVHTLEPVC